MKLIEFTKVCSRCGKRKSWKEYCKGITGRLGLSSRCKICTQDFNKKYYQLNREKLKADQRAYTKKNSKKIRIADKIRYEKHKKERRAQKRIYNKTHNKERRDWREKNIDRIKIRQKIYDEKNKDRKKLYAQKNIDRIKIRQKIYNEKNKDKRKLYLEIYTQKNKDKIKLYSKYYTRKKRKTDIKFKINSNMSCVIWHSLRKGNGKEGKSWKDMVPYTIDDLIRRLKRTLPKGYTWKDYISGKTDLQVEHIIPIAVHNFKSFTDTDFQKCWALKNLRLLPAKENMIKGAKLTKHFQPSLLL